MILDRPESIFVIVHLLKILDRITGPRAKSFKVTQKEFGWNLSVRIL